MEEQELREIARKQLKKKADFKQYLWIWFAVTILLSGIWFITTPGGYFWPMWAIFGMGIGALFAGIDAYSKNPKVITEAQIDAEVQRLKNK